MLTGGDAAHGGDRHHDSQPTGGDWNCFQGDLTERVDLVGLASAHVA
ncbi:MAG: hypothetical protein JSW68_01030 [Burkholderiales bacterium]|nr:MAG: hypothetical protein JSW68_01030 [Burkholderiales bacterium]